MTTSSWSTHGLSATAAFRLTYGRVVMLFGMFNSTLSIHLPAARQAATAAAISGMGSTRSTACTSLSASTSDS
eukprot:9234914-Pyramimonas_sp.AAC.1